MLLKLAISFLCGVVLLYLLFCLVLNAPILTGGDASSLDSDIKHRWFWVMSLYIGKAIAVGFILFILTGMFYVLIDDCILYK